MIPALRSLASVLTLVLLLAFARTGTAADGFVEGFADLPLMPGLEQIPDASLAFDAASGRIVVAFARGPVSADQIRSFYAETLGQLGWSGAGEDSFQREGERLTLDFTPDGGEMLVRFSLLPR
ncbi:hypothetical protein [Nisaea sediminum]|uniref:hypothetical protein n=1 Tax=Nisaea sediminum TaxID=2775867 RepID=UPI00186711CA|nr:hypothetical protein [Nisaea sediminum]